jgi:ABC-type transport system substrate-binding protein
MKRRELLSALPAGSIVSAAGVSAQPQGLKVIRRAFDAAETGFDPAQLIDQYSREIIGNIFEAPYRFDYLARPAKIKLVTAAALPEISPDFRTFTIRLKPGIYFQDDPAFNGKPRELLAADYVYALKRFYDPRWKSPIYPAMAEYRLLGLDALREAALKNKRPFDYDREVEGLRALDRYTFQVKLERPDPRFYWNFTSTAVYCAVAREVVERYGDQITAHPVGTGPFRLLSWRRSSLTVLEKSPSYRDVFYDEEPPADDPRSQAIAAKLKDRKLPMIDRIEFHVIEESQPRWLSFLNGKLDVLDGIPPDYTNVAIPNNRLAPNLARRGIQMDRVPLGDIVYTMFNMEDPVIGGMQPEKVALRRAISLAYDINREIRLIRRNQMVKAQSPVTLQVFGFDESFRSDVAEHDLPRAKALLDTFGYLDRDGDGWRENPDGTPLTIEYHTQSDALSRQYDEVWTKSMRELGVRLNSIYGKWPDQSRNSRAGKLMMWAQAWVTTVPDGEAFLNLMYSAHIPAGNRARFRLPAYDRLYEQQRAQPDGPERLAVFNEMKRYFATYMPYRLHGHRIRTDLAHPWVIGYRRHMFMRHYYQFVDVDLDLQAQQQA